MHVRFTPGHRLGGSVQVIDVHSGLTLAGIVTPCLFEDPTVTG